VCFNTLGGHPQKFTPHLTKRYFTAVYSNLHLAFGKINNNNYELPSRAVMYELLKKRHLQKRVHLKAITKQCNLQTANICVKLRDGRAKT
jgi:hypothetical protein